MCHFKVTLRNGAVIACRKCKQCRENRVKDWVGRCIAESETCYKANSVTLTYGADEYGNMDHNAAAILTYKHIQNMFKHLRMDGYPCRYFCVGEYGTLKARAHWHVILFWQDEPPEFPLNANCDFKYWKHGFSLFRDTSVVNIRYGMKYLTKDVTDLDKQIKIGMSKAPTLGTAYFKRLAFDQVKAGLPPSQYYSFLDVRNQFDEPIKFYLKTAALREYLDGYLEAWHDLRDGFPPVSDLLEKHVDDKCGYSQILVIEPRSYGSTPWLAPPSDAVDASPVQVADGSSLKYQFDHALNAYFVIHRGRRYFWSFDEQGKRAWHVKIRTEAQAEKLRAEFERQNSSVTYLRARDQVEQVLPPPRHSMP